MQALLADGIADFEMMWKTKLLPIHSTQIWAGKWYVFVRRSANVNMTQLDQNDLPMILLKYYNHLKDKNSQRPLSDVTNLD